MPEMWPRSFAPACGVWHRPPSTMSGVPILPGARASRARLGSVQIECRERNWAMLKPGQLGDSARACREEGGEAMGSVSPMRAAAALALASLLASWMPAAALWAGEARLVEAGAAD